MADTSDNFNITEYFNNAPIDEEIKAKDEKRAEKLKRKQLSKEEKEEKRKLNRESREKKKKVKEAFKKRKRGEEIGEEEEKIIEDNTNEDGEIISSSTNTTKSTPKKSKKEKQAEEHGVWVGNLAFSTTTDNIQKFFKDCGEIQRIKCPKGDGGRKQNKGFAYVIFTEEDAIEKAINKSEQVLDGRSLLIKNAKDFNRKDGVQPPTKESKKQKNPPCPTLFIGNLDFNTTKDMLQELFSWAGEIRSVRLGTFEDSGKCKGFGYVDYADVESATKAIRAPDKHKLGDRKVRVEFASEEAHKRSMPWLFRREKANQKNPSQNNKDTLSSSSSLSSNNHYDNMSNNNNYEKKKHSFEDSSNTSDHHQFKRPRKENTSREKKSDSHGRVKPGAALSQAQRQKPAVQEFKGTKIVFD
ncbi:unnamed protein product [Cunninghamella blakesleeana]